MKERMDVPMRLNYRLPPMAPEQVEVLANLTAHTSITMSWIPSNSVHKIRSYRIYFQRFRQQQFSVTTLFTRMSKDRRHRERLKDYDRVRAINPKSQLCPE